MSVKKFTPVLLAFAIAAGGLGCSANRTPNTTPQGYTSRGPNMVGYTTTRMAIPIQPVPLPNQAGTSRSLTNGSNAGLYQAGTPGPRTGAPAPNLAMTKAPAPKQLVTIRDDSVAIMNDVDARKWSSVASRVRLVRDNYNSLRPMLQASSVPKTRLDSLKKAMNDLERQAAAKNAYNTKLEANRMTGQLSDLTQYYRSTTTPDMSRLGYLGREIALNVEKNDWKSANTNYSTARTMWTSMSKNLGNITSVNPGHMTATMDNLGRSITAKSAASVRTGTKDFQNALSSIESYFTNLGRAR